MLNQLKCHILLYGKRLGLKVPIRENLPNGLTVEPFTPFEEENDILNEIKTYLEDKSLLSM